MSSFHFLKQLRKHCLPPLTKGLTPNQLQRFAGDRHLAGAINQAEQKFNNLSSEHKELLTTVPEQQLIADLTNGYVNFYGPDACSPYIALAAQGPWVITAHGAVVYDTGGYGMLGLGHNPPELLEVLGQPHVQANIMTPSFSQHNFLQALKKEIGHTRSTGNPYSKFMCLNSGSESVGLATRISDVHAKTMTAKGAPHEGRKSVFMTLEKSFHGRTDRPAKVSDSSRGMYMKHLKSFEDSIAPIIVTPNDIADLNKKFEQADRDNLHIEMLTVEPVAGEGNPGVPLSKEFFLEARRLTTKHHSLLLADSIQACFRTRGSMSIMDSTNCRELAPPDFETFSKALTGGQYPLSVLAINKSVENIYVRGLYGNTMTTNPRGLETATAVLNAFTPEIRENIRSQGDFFKAELEKLATKFPSIINDVTGTGLLLAAHLNEEFPVMGDTGLEPLCRLEGLNVIHGGKNAIRFTPWFHLSREEIELMIEVLTKVMAERLE